jgi:two-component system, NarL family, response regulator LiaR
MTKNATFWDKYKGAITYGISLAMLLFLLQWLKWSVLIYNHTFEFYIGCIALLFTALGIWLALKLSKPKVRTVIVEKEVFISSAESFVPNAAMLELDVLRLMAKGLSNQEIAEQLFVSLSTVKTHNQNLFIKLDVKRRTQAIDKAKSLQIIP